MMRPRLYVAPTPHTGLGLYTRRAFAQGACVFILRGVEHHWPSRTSEDAARHPNWFGIGPDRWIDPAPPFDRLNHSCEPNLGVRDEREFVALRNIAAGEELTFDYAITQDEVLWEMRCLCHDPTCRGLIRSIHYIPDAIYSRRLPFVGSYFQGVRRGFDHAQEEVSRSTEAA